MGKKIFNIKITDWFLSAYKNEDINIKKRVRIFFLIMAHSSVYWLVFISLNTVFEITNIKEHIFFIGIELIFIISILLIKIGKFKLSTVFFLIGFYSVFLLYLLYTYNEMYSIFWITLVLVFIMIIYSLIGIGKLSFITPFNIFFVLTIILYRIYVYPKYSLEIKLVNMITVCIFAFIFFNFISYITKKTTDQIMNELKNEKENLEKKVIERTNQLEDAIKGKTMFFLNIAHETKTPLTLIKNYLDEYLNDNANLKTDKIIIVKKNIDKLTMNMVNYLDTEKLSRGIDSYQNELLTEASKLLMSNIELYKTTAKIKNIEILYNIKESITIKADPLAVYKIFNNIIVNAIQYTNENGFIMINLDADENNVLFSVKDNGIGISEIELSNIFKPYYQISNEKRNSQGLGMGLFITKKLVDLLEAKISVDSFIGNGTKFSVIFKRNNINKGKEVISNQLMTYYDFIEKNFEIEDSVYNKSKRNLMIVEDNSNLLFYLKEKLGKSYNVFIAKNGRIALEKLDKNYDIDLILSDIMMDEMDGFDLIRNIQNNDIFKFIPLIFLTAKTNLDDKLTGIKLGAIDYIEKPFDINVLTAKISSILKNKKNIDYSFYNRNVKLGTLCSRFNITRRQKEIIELIKDGFEHKEIGYKLNLSVKTINAHIRILYNKLNVNNKIDLINIFYR